MNEQIRVSILPSNQRVYLWVNNRMWRGTPWIMYRGHRGWVIAPRNPNSGRQRHIYATKREALEAAKVVCLEGGNFK